MMKLIVDRIVGNIAVLEKEYLTHVEVSIYILPFGTKEGNVLAFDGNTYVLDVDSEAEARARIISKQRSIFKKK